ncbi:MAG TPA: histidine kinase [Solirubrobacterales bacterium]|nr:histidine kinase [Solirubrobacterales bacterium]
MSNRKLTALALLTLGLCATSAAIALANSAAPHRGTSAAIGAITVAALLGIGIYAWRRGGQGRFGQVLFATGLCWFLATLSNSDVDLLYSVGRISGWIFEVALIYALVSFPTGRLEGRPARLAVAGAALLVALLYLPMAPLIEQYPVPSPFTTCASHCPANSFFAGSEPGVAENLIRPLREVLTVVLYVSVVVLLSLRLRAASRNLRRTLAPVLGAAVLRFAAASLYVGLRRADAGAGALDVAGVIALLTIPATALGLLVGLLQWRIYSGGALASLTTGLAETRETSQVQALLGRSLGDPAVALYYATPAADNDARPHWLDGSDQECAGPTSGRDTCLTEAEAESGLRVAVVCDQGFSDYPDFLEAVSSCVISGLERQRLDAALTASHDDVAASRKRLAGAADGARQKIERDLHDGAQQHLVALRVKLELAREALDRDPGDAVEMVAGLGPEVDEIIEEVRSLARGIYPPLLASDGLGEALRAAGQRSPLPVTVKADGIGRFPSETESAVYFCCLEALQNAAKHAKGASGVNIELSNHGELLFVVSDDGCGLPADQRDEGSGITGMRDRLAAVGGELWIDSSRDAGTQVRGRIYLG